MTNTLADEQDEPACVECACPLEDHYFGRAYMDYSARLINDFPQMYNYEDRMPNLCVDCCVCGRDPMVEKEESK